MAQLQRLGEAIPGLESASKKGFKTAQLLNYLSSDQVSARLAGENLSKWPDPELVRLAMQVVSRAFTDEMYTRNRPITYPANGTFQIPFVIVDKPSSVGDERVGSMNGILRFTPRIQGEQLRLTVRLEQASYYHEICAGLIVIGDSCTKKAWRNYVYTRKNASKFITNARLMRFKSGQTPSTLALSVQPETK